MASVRGTGSSYRAINVLTSLQWETVLTRDKCEALAMTQAAVIGQTFGMLSGVCVVGSSQRRFPLASCIMLMLQAAAQRFVSSTGFSWHCDYGKLSPRDTRYVI